MFDFLQTGPLMDEGGDMGGGGGGGEVATLDTSLESTETALVPAGETTTESTESGDDSQALQLFDHRGKPTKQFSDSIAAVPARQRGVIHKAIGAQQRLVRELGPRPWDTIRDMRAVERDIQELGGYPDTRAALDQIRSDIHSVQELDRLYSMGDPRMIEQMTEQPEGRAVFPKIMPSAIQKWEQLAPQAFSAYIASRFLGHMRSPRKIAGANGQEVTARFLWDLEDLERNTPAEFLGADGTTKIPNPAVAILTRMKAFVEELGAIERSAPSQPENNKPDPARAELDQQRQQLETDRRNLQAQQWRSAANQDGMSVYGRAFEAETKGRKPGPEQKSIIQSQVAIHLKQAMQQEAGYQQRLKHFGETGDREGYLRYMHSLHEKHLPRLIRKYVGDVMGAKPGPASGGVAATTVAAGKTVEAGFQRGPRPASNDVDRRQTTSEMWLKGQAVLKNGTRVQFK